MPMRMVRTAAVALSFALLIGTTRAEEAKPLRLCADPTNPPFSIKEPKGGLYLELGEAIGKALGRPVTEVWYLSYFGKRALRTTLLAGQCDLWIGLPEVENFMGPQVIFSKPFMTIGYALVVPKDWTVKSLDDLKGKRIAVQFRSTPQNILALRDDITAVTVKSPEAGIDAVVAGEADAAFVWAPVAGYKNLTALNGAYRIVPVTGEALEWPVAIGFSRKRGGSLRDQVDQILPGLSGTIETLKAKYGFPSEAPIKLGEAPSQSAPAVQETKATNAESEGTEDGQSLFNGTCAHCHGPNAVQAERKIDLRRLQRKYGDKLDAVFHQTMQTGRPAKGMPAWKGIFTDEQFNRILAYLKTVQTQ